MPFKVVQTIEDGEMCLSVIPSGWESKGILRWPKKHLVGKLAQVESSVPDEKWERMNCVCKREYTTRLEAEAEMERMEYRPDTEIEDTSAMAPPKKKVRNEQSIKSSENFEPRNFNTLIATDSANPDESSTVINHDEAVLEPTVNEEQIFYVKPQCTITEGQVNESSQIIYVQTGNLNGDGTAINTDSNVLATVISNQNMIMNNQTNLMKCMARMQTTLDFLVESSAQYDAPHKVYLPKEYETESIIAPVECLADLNNLEKLLDDQKNLQKLSSSMAFICGTGGKAQGIDCCYKLVDYFFTRQFLTQCSWTGAARLTDANARSGPSDENESGPSTSSDVAGKVPLKFFRKTRQLFLNLVMRADKDFSELDSEKFFKTVLKNSKQRTTAKSLTSKHKNRPTNLKYKTSKTNDENQPVESDSRTVEGDALREEVEGQ